jgi:maltose alpha-D-glucosyltransferase/alpha-amylase
MQWSSDHYGGYSRAEIVVPIIDDGEHGYRKVNVADQRRDPNSLLNWVERRIRARKELVELGWGECDVLSADNQYVLVLRFKWRNTAVVTIHNFADANQTVHFDAGTPDGGMICDVFDEDHSRADASGQHELELGPYMHKWYRVGGPDSTQRRAEVF